MAAGLGATFAAFKGLDFLRESVNDVESLARSTIKLQAITGQDAKTASSWIQIAKQRGISAQQLSRGFVTLEKNQTKAAAGSKTQAEAFRSLGISQEALKRSSPNQLILQVADGMNRLGPGAKRAAAAQALFGRAGVSLIATLSGGSQKLRDQLQIVQRYGASLDQHGVRNAMKLVAEQRKLNFAMDGLKVTVGQAVIPLLTKGGHALSTFVAQMRSGTGTGGQVRKVFEQVAAAVGETAKALGPAAKGLAQAFGPAARVAATAIRGMTQTIRGIVGVVKGVVSVATHLIRGDFAGAWRAVKGIVRSALSGLGGLVKTLMAPVYTFAASAVRRAVRAVGGLGGGIVGAIRGAIGAVAGAARAVGSAIYGAFRSTVSRITSLFRSVFNGVKSIISSIKSAISDVTNLPGLKQLKDAAGVLGLRKGGIVGRYQGGGMVPAMVSPGEMIIHQGRAGIVPGQPVAADNVGMMLPVGAAVITGHGQQLLAAGASVSETVARQAPHFAAGGHVRGKLSWFGGPHDSQDSGKTALGLTTATPGVAIRPGDTWQTGRATLGRYWRIRTPNGRSAVLRQTDLGPNQSTGRRIDLTYSALGRLGYTEGSFPTDRVGVADLVGGPAARAASQGGSYRVSGYAAALARRVGRSRIRSGILGDAFDQGVAQGEAGMTRARLRALGDPVYRAISAAYRVPGDKIVRVAGRATGGASPGGGSRPLAGRHAWRGLGQAGLGAGIVNIAGRVMGAFPGLRVSSTTGGRHAKNSWHYKGRAVDLAGGNMNAAAQWVWRNVHRSLIEGIHNPNLSVAGGRGVPASYWGPTTWGQHANHIHLAARRGGVVPRFQTGGRVPRYTYATPGERGSVIRGDEFGVYNQPSRGFGGVLGGAMFPVVRASNAAFARRFAALNAAIQNAAADKIAALRRGLVGAVRRGGSEVAVKRMQQAIDLVDRELGRRIGLLSRRIAARTAAADTRVARTDIGLRIRGVDPDSPAAITERLGAERFRGDALHRTGRDLDKQLRLAEKARNLAKITEIRQEIADNQTAILDSRANQAELGRARAEAQRSARTAFAQGLTDLAASRTSLAQVGLQGIELTQRLAGSYDKGGQQRADYILSTIVPDLQAEQAGIRAQGIEAMRQNNADLARQLTQAYAEKQNEILQAQLDAQEATAQNTEQTADALKNLGGTLGFDFGGARMTDALIASGIGA